MEMSGKRKLTASQIVMLLLVTLIGILLEVFVCLNFSRIEEKREIDSAQVYGETVSKAISMTLEQSISTTQLLKNLYEEYGQEVTENFDRICSRFLSDYEAVESLYIAPQGIIQYAYPESMIESTIGANLLTNPEQGERARLAVESRQMTVAGPHYLLEGGTGFIIRTPVYNGDFFDCLVISVINWDSFTSQIDKFLDEENSDYNIALWKDDNSNTVIDSNGFIFANSNKNISRIVDIEINVPNDLWHLSIEPKRGWNNSKAFMSEKLIFGLMFFLIVAFIWIRQIEATKKMYTFEHDALTGLYTRSAFYRRANKLLRENPEESFDVVVADIENFKVINAIYGTAKCDELLCYLAKCYAEDNPNNVCGRYGGDQFISIFRSSENNGALYLESRSRAIIEDAPIKDIVLKYGFYGHIDRSLPINLISDRALLAAKSILHNYDIMIANYEGAVSSRHLKEQMLESSFEKALNENAFQVWYQPKFDAKTEKLVGAEALVRWVKEDGSIVSPSDFIYVFENDGLIVHLDEYVFRNVCNSIKKWIGKGVKTVPISINLSRASLHHKGIIQKYRRIVDDFGIPISSISLELTESTVFTNIQIKELAEELKAAGFTIDMDDFGTGSSSLASLNILPFDAIKIDKSLVDFIGTPDGDELVRHTIELAHFKNMRVVAEGVEKKEQLDFLRELNCDAIQGFYYMPPIPFDECVKLLKKLYTENRV